MTFAENIKKYRTAAGLTQEELAEKVGISGQAVSKWETSDTMPDTAILPDIADALNVSIDMLFGHESVSADAVMPALFGYITKGNPEKSLDRRMYDVITAAYKASTWQDYGDEDWWYRDWYGESSPYGSMCRIHLFTDEVLGVMFDHPEFAFCTTVPEPKDGYEMFINENSTAYLTALADPDVRKCVVTMLKRDKNLLSEYELAVLLRNAGVDAAKENEIAEKLKALGRLVYFNKVEINGQTRTLIRCDKCSAVYFLSIYANAYAASYRRESITGCDGHDRSAPILK